MDNHSLIKGLREHDKTTIRYIRDKFLPMIEALVRKYGTGNYQDAEDVFMNALEIFYLKALDDDFILTSSFSTLLYEIAKRQWLKMLVHKNRTVRVTSELQNALIGEGFGRAIEQSEKYQLYREKFIELSEGCRKVLQMTLDGYAMKEIAEAMGFASEQYTRKRKFKCKEKLMKLIREDQRYHELKDYDGGRTG